MTLGTLITFHTNLPDDAIETADGMNFIQWPGRNVVEVIAELLKGLGWKPNDPIDLEERGWDLDAVCSGGAIRLRIEVLEEVIVQVTDDLLELTRYFRRKPPGPVFVGLLIALDEAMKADSRFKDILWFTPKGYLNHELGAPSPVDP